MKAELKRLVSRIHKHLGIPVPETQDLLTPDELSSMRRRIPFATTELFDWLQVCNPCVTNLFPYFEGIAPGTYADRIIGEIEFRKEVDGMFVDSFVGWTSSTNDACRHELSWRESWIPIGEFNGDLLFIDCDPSPDGRIGQVVETSDDGRYLTVVGHSIHHWMTRLCAAIDSPNEHPEYNSVYLGPAPVE